MKCVWVLGKIVCVLLVCASFATSDSLELRSGRHLQGKYVGGTATLIGFMSGNAVEYFNISDVTVLRFDRNLDSPWSGVRPGSTQGNPSKEAQGGNAHQVDAHVRIRKAQPRLKRASLSTRSVVD